MLCFFFLIKEVCNLVPRSHSVFPFHLAMGGLGSISFHIVCLTTVLMKTSFFVVQLHVIIVTK